MRTAVLVLAALALVTTPSAVSAPATVPVSVQASEPVVLPLASGDVLVAWTPVAGAKAYVVLRGETPDALEPVGVTSAPFFLDMKAQAGLRYAAVPFEPSEPRSTAATPPSDQPKCGVVHNGGGNAQVYASGCVHQGPN